MKWAGALVAVTAGALLAVCGLHGGGPDARAADQFWSTVGHVALTALAVTVGTVCALVLLVTAWRARDTAPPAGIPDGGRAGDEPTAGRPEVDAWYVTVDLIGPGGYRKRIGDGEVAAVGPLAGADEHQMARAARAAAIAEYGRPRDGFSITARAVPWPRTPAQSERIHR